MIAHQRGEHVITLAGAELAYRILFDQMNEGAVTLTQDGVVAYCNRRFAEIVSTPIARIVGVPLRRFVAAADAAAFDAMRDSGGRENARADLTFRAGDGVAVPVAVSFAPLHADGGDEVIGVVGVVRDITERRLAEAQRARLVGQVMTAQEEERRRIARELHDEIGQSLTALLVGLRTIEGAKTVAQSVTLARGLRATTAQTLIDVGRLWRGLHPGVLDDLGLAAALIHHVQEFAQVRGIAVDLQTTGLEADGLSPILQATVYRVVQEALTNVAQHARARNASVRVWREAGTVEVWVQDDGDGLGSGNAGRLGLRGMKERAVLLGGTIEVKSRARKGTTLTAHFPVGSE